jgi:hypothetical protein
MLARRWSWANSSRLDSSFFVSTLVRSIVVFVFLASSNLTSILHIYLIELHKLICMNFIFPFSKELSHVYVVSGRIFITETTI